MTLRHPFDRWRVAILEDTGALFGADAGQRTGQGLARLLNATDGMLAKGSRTLFVIATNEPISHFHQAAGLDRSTRTRRRVTTVHLSRIDRCVGGDVGSTGYAGQPTRRDSGGGFAMRRSFAVALAATTLLALIANSGVARATLPGRNGRIAFSTDVLPDNGLGSSQIYTIRPDGTGVVQLTHEPDGVNAHRAAWSPDGRKLLFNRETQNSAEIWIMNRDGSGQHQLVHDTGHQDFDSAWSPDGTHIAFSRCADPFGPCGIAVANTDGSGIHTIVDGNSFAGTPRYSPDGRRIVFDSDRGGFLDAIWVVNRNGGGLKRLTPPSLEAFYPDWSPDGTRIVFTDNCCRFGSNVWTVAPDGSGLTRLTNFPTGHQGGFARYSPDSQKIVLIADLRYSDNCCSDLYVMNADGSRLHPIVTDQPYLFFADWGPQVTP